MLKLKCGWELPDELGFSIDSGYDHEPTDDLISDDPNRTCVTLRDNKSWGDVDVKLFFRGECLQFSVLSMNEFIAKLASKRYPPATIVMRQRKIENLLDAKT